ncbi:MAG: S41 family peptidase [Planctomycetales bacterium]|nr:S41 family peptidase [Planctomycetales bacterium]
MTRRNLTVLFLVAIVSLVCFRRAERNPFARFLAHALQKVETEALNPVSSQDLFDGAMEGMVEQLDEYSGYINAKDAAEFEADLTQEFGGVGVLIRLEPAGEAPGARQVLTVINPPLFGTPAQKVGIEVRDQILEINGLPTSEMTMRDVLHTMRGPVGEPVALLVNRDGFDQPRTFDVVREVINVPSVVGSRPHPDGSWKFALEQDPRIAHLRILNFGEKTSEEFAEAMQSVHEQGFAAVVIDLRDNPGGLLDAAVEISDLFLPADREIVSIRGRGDKPRRQYIATGDGPYPGIPLVVMVNHYSASASEILAACLQDNQRAIIVGQRSWGKGTIQHVIPIQAGKALLKLTAARYVRPNGANIHRAKDAREEDAWGVMPKPEMTIRLTEREMALLRNWRQQQDIVITERSSPPTPESYAGEPPEPALAEPADSQLELAIETLQQILDGRRMPGSQE